MRAYNVMMVFNPDLKQLLMCMRGKDPYKGLLNLVGGKVEPGEDGLCAAYRELFEETGISKRDIRLAHLMDFTYHCEDAYLEVYAGKLLQAVSPHGDENELCWVSVNENFFDTTRFAGMGNIGHMMLQARAYADRIGLSAARH